MGTLAKSWIHHVLVVYGNRWSRSQRGVLDLYEVCEICKQSRNAALADERSCRSLRWLVCFIHIDLDPQTILP